MVAYEKDLLNWYIVMTVDNISLKKNTQLVYVCPSGHLP